MHACIRTICFLFPLHSKRIWLSHFVKQFSLNVFWLSFFSANLIHILCSFIAFCSCNTYDHKCLFFFCYLIICLLLYLSIYEFWFILHYSFVTFCLSLYNVRAATYKTIITFVNIGYFSVTFNYHFCLNLDQETRFL